MAGFDVGAAAEAVRGLAASMRSSGVAFATFHAGPVASLQLAPEALLPQLPDEPTERLTPEEHAKRAAAREEELLYGSSAG
jgi:hypothetical protein